MCPSGSLAWHHAMAANVVHFKLTMRLQGLQAGPPPETEVRFGHEDAAVSLIRDQGPEGQISEDMVLTATARRDVPSGVIDTLRSFLARRESEKVEAKPHFSEDVLVVTGADVGWVLEPPQEVALVFGDVFDRLAGLALRWADLLKWRFNRPQPANPMTQASFLWSLDEQEWTAPPGGLFRAPVMGSTGPILENDVFAEIYEWWKSPGAIVPLSRQILIDSNAELGDNNRAAYVLAVAAAEVGVKEFCSLRGGAESESWLLREMASPPLRRLLREYIVFFTDRRTTDGHVFPRQLVAELDRAVETRNRIIHRGEQAPTDEQTSTMLVAASDLLYLLDWFAGHEWALGYVSADTAASYEPE
jgi:hypothetical protein